MNDSDAADAGGNHHDQHILTVPQEINECKSSSDSVSSFGTNLSLEKSKEPFSVNAVAFSGSSIPIASPKLMNSSDDELEYILGKSECSRAPDKTSVDERCQDTSNSNEVENISSLKTPIFEDMLNFEEDPEVQYKSSSPLPSLSLSPISPLTSTFPSDARISDGYTYFTADDIDYCNEIFGIKSLGTFKDTEEGDDKNKVLNTSRRSSESISRVHIPFGGTNNQNDHSSLSTSVQDGATFKSLLAPATAAASQYFPDSASKHILVTPSNSFLHDGTVIPNSNSMFTCPPLPRLAASDATTEQAAQQCKSATKSNNSKSDIAWNQRYAELQKFKETHGHCNVPQKFEKNKSLGAWVARNRLFMRQFEQDVGTLRTSSVQCERMRRLEEIGLVPSLGKGAFGRTNGLLMSSRNARDWENQFNTLQEYKAIHGDCDVPVKSKAYKSLGRWVSAQRKKYHQYFGEGADLTPSNDLVLRFERMKEIGFNFVIGSGKAKRVKLSTDD